SFTNIALSFGTLFMIIAIYRFSTGFMRAISILIGLIIGTIVASFFGLVDFQNVKDASYVHMVVPFYFGVPTFNLLVIITMYLFLILYFYFFSVFLLSIDQILLR